MSNDSEEERLIETGRMAARLIHDFKNQLSGLKLYAAYLKKRFADNPEGLEIAEKIDQGLNEMADQAAILNKLTRPLELRCEPGDPALVVEQVVAGHRAEAGKKNIRIEYEVESDLPQMPLDWQQVRAALESILARAIDLSPEGGVVSVSVKRRDEVLQIEIADQGETLDAGQRRALFDGFTSERISRTSLGMALARRIVEQHGGEVAVQAASPAGTIVELRLQIEN
jgi:signal transduction histidine kinase